MSARNRELPGGWDAVVGPGSQIADSIPQISGNHPYLFSHPWMAFGDHLRSPISWHGVQSGLVTQAAYIAIFLTAAWARLRTKDITA